MLVELVPIELRIPSDVDHDSGVRHRDGIAGQRFRAKPCAVLEHFHAGLTDRSKFTFGLGQELTDQFFYSELERK